MSESESESGSAQSCKVNNPKKLADILKKRMLHFISGYGVFISNPKKKQKLQSRWKLNVSNDRELENQNLTSALEIKMKNN